MFNDLRLSARMVRRSPAFALTALLVLALGTGGATAIFSVLDAVVLRPLPYPEADRLVMLWDTHAEKHLTHEPISPVTFLDDRSLPHVFADAAAWWRPEMTLTQAGQDPLRVNAIETSRNLFDVVAVQPRIGPGFARGPSLHVQGSQEVVISHRLWQSRFESDPALIGQSITLSSEPFTVVGVMPPGFTFPGDTDVWQGLRWDFALHSRSAHFMEAVARLAPGATVEQAGAELAALGRRLGSEFPGTNQGWQTSATRLVDEIVGGYRAALYVLTAAVALLLVIACVNVANLLLARSSTRAREMAVRAAIGASRARLVGQLLTESLTLAVGGTLAGLLLAWGGIRLLVAADFAIPRIQQVAINGRVAVFSALLAAATAIVFGLIPAWLASSPDLIHALKDGGRGAGPGSGTRRLRQVLVAGEVALSVALLAAAVLILRSVERLSQQESGVRPENVLTASINLPPGGYREFESVGRFYEQVTAELREQPGIVDATTSNFLPLATGWRIPFLIVGRPPADPQNPPQVQHHTVGTHYLETLGVPLLAGRTLDAHDTLESRGVVVINEAMARAYWPDGGAVGAHVRVIAKRVGPLGARLTAEDEFEVVGIVGDVKNSSLRRAAEPAMYFSTFQFPFREMYLQVRGVSSAASVLAAIRRTVWGRDPSLPISKVRTMDDVLGESLARPRFLMLLMSGFAGLALILASVGLYGVLAYAVAERRREIGVRMALGARRATVTWLVVRQGLWLTLAGIGLGTLTASLGARSLAAVLGDIRPADPLAFFAVTAIVTVVSMIASYLPARRASRIEPVRILRDE